MQNFECKYYCWKIVFYQIFRMFNKTLYTHLFQYFLFKWSMVKFVDKIYIIALWGTVVCIFLLPHPSANNFNWCPMNISLRLKYWTYIIFFAHRNSIKNPPELHSTTGWWTKGYTVKIHHIGIAILRLVMLISFIETGITQEFHDRI